MSALRRRRRRADRPTRRPSRSHGRRGKRHRARRDPSSILRIHARKRRTSQTDCVRPEEEVDGVVSHERRCAPHSGSPALRAAAARRARRWRRARRRADSPGTCSSKRGCVRCRRDGRRRSREPIDPSPGSMHASSSSARSRASVRDVDSWTNGSKPLSNRMCFQSVPIQKPGSYLDVVGGRGGNVIGARVSVPSVLAEQLVGGEHLVPRVLVILAAREPAGCLHGGEDDLVQCDLGDERAVKDAA